MVEETESIRKREAFKAWSEALDAARWHRLSLCIEDDELRGLFKRHVVLHSIATNDSAKKNLEERLDAIEKLSDRMTDAETISRMSFAPEQCVVHASVDSCLEWANATETTEVFPKILQIMETCLDDEDACKNDKEKIDYFEDGVIWINYAANIIDYLVRLGVGIKDTPIHRKMKAFIVQLEYRAEEYDFEASDIFDRGTRYLKPKEREVYEHQLIFDVYTYKKNRFKNTVLKLVKEYQG